MILYIGNKLLKHGNTPTSVDVLGEQLKEWFDIISVSDKKNQFLRLIDMLYAVVHHRHEVSKVLIDTYSSLNFYYALLVSILCKYYKISYIPILHGGSLPERLDRSSIVARFIFKHSYINISPSGYLRAEFAKRGVDNVVLIPNNINVADYTYKKRMDVRPRLLWVRSFAAFYNPMMAIRIVKRLLDKYPDACLCMVGQDKDGSMEKCKLLAKKLGVMDKVRFTGKLSKAEWRKLSEQYDIFINTTNIDNTPVSVIEAMALGLPVISTNVGGIPYLLEDGKDAFLVDPENENDMLASIEKLVSDPAEALRISQFARKKAETFDWEVVKESWIKILL